jgi:hypothetical protein
MANFIDFLNDSEHPIDHQYAFEELIQLTPSQIINIFTLKAFEISKDSPINEATNRITEWRGVTLESYKRSISHFMPNRIQSWYQMNQNSNPTKSTD